MKNTLGRMLLLGLCALVAACGGEQADTKPAAESTGGPTEANPGAGNISRARLENASQEPEQWLTYGGSYDETRHSTLTKINRDTLSDLGIGWVYEMKKPRGVEATPIVVDGTMYVSGAWSVVYALDARSGEELWVYDPYVSGEAAAKGCCDVVNRGVAVYDGKVYVGVFDGRLEALDASTGEVVWSQVTVDQSLPYTITGAPRVFKDKVIIGNGGAELGVRGYVTAYDAATGEQAWRFYTVPNPNKEPDGAASDAIFAQLANETWGDTGAWTTEGGGGTVWDTIVYDAANDQVLLGVGNGSPWNAQIRDPDSNGDNLFLASIVAVDADTGAYRWHYQTTPRDTWDYTATQPMVLADLPLGPDGADRRVVMQAPKNGFFYILDAADGELISATPFAEMSWATGIDENGRPIEVPEARSLEEDFVMLPGPTGAHNWHPMSYNPDTGLVYIPTNVLPGLFSRPDGEEAPESNWNINFREDAGWPLAMPNEMLGELRSSAGGALLAWDPVKAEPRWAVPFPVPFNGGTLSLASGLVFQANKGGELVAYDAETGARVWSHGLVGGPGAAPVTYEVDGEQYMAVLSGWGSTIAMGFGLLFEDAVTPELGRVLAFKLGGTGTLPKPLDMGIARTPKSPLLGDEAQQLHGLSMYAANCQWCHGAFAISSGVLPDLRWSAVTATDTGWDAVVRDGALSAQGMMGVADRLSKEDTDAIRAYVVKQAWDAVARGDADAPGDDAVAAN
ncbi:MAG: PQQ-dependent dehydrogenase, methanol/ethanol family [Luminiphilus sp.]